MDNFFYFRACPMDNLFCNFSKRNFTLIEKIGTVHLVKFYDGEGKKYPEVSRVKYQVLPKCGTKYQKWWDQVLI